MNAHNKQFGERLKWLIKWRGKTQGELAKAIGVTPGAISQVVNGLTEMKPDNRRKVAEALDVPLPLLEADLPLSEWKFGLLLRFLNMLDTPQRHKHFATIRHLIETSEDGFKG